MRKLKHIKLLNIRSLSLITLLFCTCVIFAQNVPKGINYQAALRDLNGKPIADSTITLGINILQGGIGGESVYFEQHLVTTNKIGLFSLVIGDGESIIDFGSIDWSLGAYFLELVVDGQSFSTTPLLSVPYAFHAASADKLSALDLPTKSSDPTSKLYVDSVLNEATTDLASQEFVKDELDKSNTKLNLDSVIQDAQTDMASIAFVQSELAKTNGIEFSNDGDTLFAGGTPIIIPGLNAKNISTSAFQRCLGGSGNEVVRTFFKTPENTYILGVETTSRNGDIPVNFGQTDIWIAEIDSSFNILWQKGIGGSHYDHISHVIPINDSELLIGCTTESNTGDVSGNHGGYDVFLAILDKDHNIRWSKCFGGTNADFLNDIKVLEDGSFLIGATTFSDDQDVEVNYGNSDIWIVKLDPRQELEWKKTYGSLRYESLNSLAVRENKILLFGETESNSGMVKANHGGLDIWLASLNMDGDLEQQRCIGSVNNEELNQVELTDDGILIGGTSFSSDWDPANSIPQKNVWISKISYDLGSSESVNYGGNGAEQIVKILLSDNQELLFAASSSSYDGDVANNYGDQDFWVFTTDASLNLLTQQNFGGSYGEQLSVAKRIDGGYLFAGTSESSDENLNDNNGETDIWLVKTDDALNIIDAKHYGGSRAESVFDVILEGQQLIIIGATGSNDYGIKGFHGKPGSTKDIWLIKDAFDSVK